MKIIAALKTGASRSVKAWKGAMIICLALLILISLFAIPVKGVLKAGFGSSTITNELLKDFNLDVIGDLVADVKGLASFSASGFFLIFFTGILLYVFFSGGLFNCLKVNSGRFTVTEFFRASAKNFWSFFGITLIISLILFVLSLFIIAVPAGISFASNTETDTVRLIAVIVSAVVLIFAQILLFTVADFARAGYVAGGKPAVFKAIGYGFKMTFDNFLSAVPLMLVLYVVQSLFGGLVMKIILSWKPATGGTVFLLFILSQLLFFVIISLRSWRYASITSLMEKIEQRTVPTNENTMNDII